VHPTRRSPRLWLAVLGAAVVAAGGGVAAREFYKPKPADPVAAPPVVTTAPSTTVPAEAQPGPRKVMATQDVVVHPQFPEIGQMLQDYFDSINAKDYDKWRTAVVRLWAQRFPEQDWKSNYKSTQDGSILVKRIDTAPDRKLRVMLAFTSTQAIEDAPPELPKGCIRWHIVLPLSREDNKWKIDVGPESSSPRHDECGVQTS
jgi:hypothetical protein